MVTQIKGSSSLGKRKRGVYGDSSKRVKMSQQTIAKIARKTLLSMEETKSFLSADLLLQPVDNSWQIRNLLHPISTGAGSQNMIGRKMFIKNIRFRCNMFFNPTSNTTSANCRVVVFKHKDTITTTSANSPTGTEFLRSSVGQPAIAHVDLNKVITLLYDKTITMTRQIDATQVVQRPLEFNIPINRTESFNGDASGLLDDGQYYLAFIAQNGNLTTNAVSFNFQYAVNFKDA